MRLPESMTRISPVGETLDAADAGETLLAGAVETANDRLLVASADAEGLSRWERDYGLADRTGESAEGRRARLRGARVGGQTLTRERLRALAISVGGAEDAEISEDFSAYSVSVALYGTPERLSGGVAALRSAVERQKPAHLCVSVQPTVVLASARGETRHGGAVYVLWAQESAI